MRVLFLFSLTFIEMQLTYDVLVSGVQQSDSIIHIYLYIVLRFFSIIGYYKILSTAPVLPWQLSGEVSACNTGDTGSIPGSATSPGEGTHSSNLPENSHEQRSLGARGSPVRHNLATVPPPLPPPCAIQLSLLFIYFTQGSLKSDKCQLLSRA